MFHKTQILFPFFLLSLFLSTLPFVFHKSRAAWRISSDYPKSLWMEVMENRMTNPRWAQWPSWQFGSLCPICTPFISPKLWKLQPKSHNTSNIPASQQLWKGQKVEYSTSKHPTAGNSHPLTAFKIPRKVLFMGFNNFWNEFRFSSLTQGPTLMWRVEDNQWAGV